MLLQGKPENTVFKICLPVSEIKWIPANLMLNIYIYEISCQT